MYFNFENDNSSSMCAILNYQLLLGTNFWWNCSIGLRYLGTVCFYNIVRKSTLSFYTKNVKLLGSISKNAVWLHVKSSLKITMHSTCRVFYIKIDSWWKTQKKHNIIHLLHYSQTKRNKIWITYRIPFFHLAIKTVILLFAFPLKICQIRNNKGNLSLNYYITFDIQYKRYSSLYVYIYIYIYI